jgi:hypothetical protein
VIRLHLELPVGRNHSGIAMTAWRVEVPLAHRIEGVTPELASTSTSRLISSAELQSPDESCDFLARWLPCVSSKHS